MRVLILLSLFFSVTSLARAGAEIPSSASQQTLQGKDHRTTANARLIDATNQKDWQAFIKYASQCGADKSEDQGLHWVYLWCLYELKPDEYAKRYVEAFPTADEQAYFLNDYSKYALQQKIDFFATLGEIAEKGNPLAIEKVFSIQDDFGKLYRSLHKIRAEVFSAQQALSIEAMGRAQGAYSSSHFGKYWGPYLVLGNYLVQLAIQKDWSKFSKFVDTTKVDKIKQDAIHYTYLWCLYALKPDQYAQQYVDAFPTQGEIVCALFEISGQADGNTGTAVFDFFDTLGEIAQKGNVSAIDKMLRIKDTDGAVSEDVDYNIARMFLRQPEKTIESWSRFPKSNNDYNHYEYLGIMANNDLEKREIAELRSKLMELQSKAFGEKKAAVVKILKELNKKSNLVK